MAAQDEVLAKRGTPTGVWRTVARAALVILALILLWAENRVLFHWYIHASATFVKTWGGWLWSLALLVLAGVAFGLAAMLPERARYRPTRALLLGIVPLLLLVHLTLSIGPADRFAAQHLRFLVGRRVFFFDELQVGYAFAVMLGVAVAAGFASGD